MFTEKVVKSSETTGFIYNVLWADTVCWQYEASTEEQALERGRQWFAVKFNQAVRSVV